MTEPEPRAGASKAAWRAWARGLAPVDATTTRSIGEHLRAFLDRSVPIGLIVGYDALADEVAIDDLCAVDRRALPRLAPDGTMELGRDTGGRTRHRLGFEQPVDDAPVVHVDEVAAIVIPGRVFDRRGMRLGRGGGHYDRLLARLGPAVITIGVAPEAHIVERLPSEDHDLAMTHLATELGVRRL